MQGTINDMKQAQWTLYMGKSHLLDNPFQIADENDRQAGRIMERLARQIADDILVKISLQEPLQERDKYNHLWYR